MPLPFLVPAIISGIGALAGAMGNRSQKTKQESTSSTKSTNTTNPNYDPSQLGIRDFILNRLMSGVEDTPEAQQAYLSGGLANINRGADVTANNIRQAMISRGLGRTSAGFAPEIANEGARFQALSQFENQAPLVMEERQRKRLGDLGQFFSSLPVGSIQTGDSTTTGSGSTTTPGNMLGGALQGGASMAAFLYGKGAFGGGGSGALNSDAFGATGGGRR